MGIDINKFEEIKNKARRIIKEDAKKDSAIIKARQADRNNPAFFRDQPTDSFSQVTSFNNSTQTSINEDYSDQSEEKLYSAMDNKMKQYVESKQQAARQQQNNLQINSKLPKEILESFSKNYIDQSVFNPNMSVLDKIGITSGDEYAVQENNTQQAQQITNNGKIDYELIKSIVESSVKKYVNALGKKMLTENTSVRNIDEINAIQITDKKIAIVTKSGNLYEGKLEFKRNIKK